MVKRIGLTVITLGLALSASSGAASAAAPADAHVQVRLHTTHASIWPLCLHQRRHKVNGHWSKWHTFDITPNVCR